MLEVPIPDDGGWFGDLKPISSRSYFYLQATFLPSLSAILI